MSPPRRSPTAGAPTSGSRQPLLEFLEVELRAPASALAALDEFYDERLAVPRSARPRFVPGEGAPFYHFALLAPGDRFGELLHWVRGRVELLPDPESGDLVFDFENWSARACYFHDPAGNIVELITHRGVGETGARGPFAAGELLGFSELGLVGDPATMAAELERLGLRLWAGSTEEEGRLGFVGEQARTLILSPAGRGWLPTGRAAEPHPVAVVLSGPEEREAMVDGHRIRRRPV